ncbi:PEP/pyruvate-binding domain-containing protein [Actinoplanes regularis]|uniref:Pyruvate, water dikinase n=1 Tax=Actinoplanes regularis TaxID=52697 RepID=A0A239JLE9_9ACTN|nr:PEP/pyruvate-binding domain-containing protein [Actinoplanes regularis]SNT06228.1 pyruvate, water dikinase [Actinoplanes regularis]
MSVIPLTHADHTCGNKAGTLAILLRAGLPVPDGFVVTDPALDPAPIAEHLHRLRGRAVAVRSSGLTEDSATASHAGQLSTVLGARGLDEVLAALRHCATSPDTDRARGYRTHLNLDDETTAPVLVQELIEADHAGVLFTRDPRTGTDSTVINASWGLGESVVSGAVVPDEFVVSAETGAVHVTVGTKQTRLDLQEQGLRRTPVAEPDRNRRCVTPDQVRRLVTLGRRCADLLGGPQDLEWAIRDDRIWLLQARPITTPGTSAATTGPADAPPLITGVPSSPGRASGPARLLHSVDDFARLQRGDILVCRTTDPAWTPLFRLAAAVVTETGGILSHASIVAREFGIPAIVGAGTAMTRLSDDTPITVDGTVGTVTRGPRR